MPGIAWLSCWLHLFFVPISQATNKCVIWKPPSSSLRFRQEHMACKQHPNPIIRTPIMLHARVSRSVRAFGARPHQKPAHSPTSTTDAGTPPRPCRRRRDTIQQPFPVPQPAGRGARVHGGQHESATRPRANWNLWGFWVLGTCMPRSRATRPTTYAQHGRSGRRVPTRSGL